MKQFCLILAGVLMVLACSHEKKVIEKKKSPEAIIGMEKDTLSIDLDDTSLPHYPTLTAFSLNTNDYLIGYNDQTHALDVFDFTNGVVRDIRLYRENYDPYRKRYYRLHVNGIDFTAGMAIDKQLFKKQLFLTVFDQDLNVIDEFPLSNDTYNLNGGWGVFEKGFFIIKDHPNAEFPDDDKMKYDVFRFG